jgi:hypothetical protein
VHLRSTNLDDLLPALKWPREARPSPCRSNYKTVWRSLTLLSWRQIRRRLPAVAVTNVLYAQAKIDAIAADIAVQKSELRVQNATLARGKLRGQLSATIALRDWKPDDAGALTATASVRGADVQDLLAFAGKQGIPATGTFSASAQVTGTVGTPLIKADVSANDGSVYNEPFDRFAAHLDYRDRLVTIASVELNAGAKE